MPYAPGELVARGYQTGKLVASQTVATTGPAASIAADTTRHTSRPTARTSLCWS